MEKDINDIVVSLEVSNEELEKVKQGEIWLIIIGISKDNPYYDKLDSLKYMNLIAGEEVCLTRILDIVTEPGDDGSSLTATFNIITLYNRYRNFLMRWNPAISSFKEKDFEDCVKNQERGRFHLKWSIYDWEKARRGDTFYMLRVGDDKAGIVFRGFFLSDPYTGEDWAGADRRRCYVDMVCQDVANPGDENFISLKELKKEFPNYNWKKGHSGELLPDDVVEMLGSLTSPYLREDDTVGEPY